jgi:hypothetical protein
VFTRPKSHSGTLGIAGVPYLQTYSTVVVVAVAIAMWDFSRARFQSSESGKGALCFPSYRFRFPLVRASSTGKGQANRVALEVNDHKRWPRSMQRKSEICPDGGKPIAVETEMDMGVYSSKISFFEPCKTRNWAVYPGNGGSRHDQRNSQQLPTVTRPVRTWPISPRELHCLFILQDVNGLRCSSISQLEKRHWAQ